MSLLLLPLRLTTLLLVVAVPLVQLLMLLPQPLLPTNGKHGHYKQVSKNAHSKGRHIGSNDQFVQLNTDLLAPPDLLPQRILICDCRLYKTTIYIS